MKKLLTLIAIMALAVSANAWVSSHVHSGVIGDGNDRDMFYCQTPHMESSANGQLAYLAECADDIPAEYAGQTFNQVGAYCLQWGGGEADPVGIYINIYEAACPPTMDPAASYFFPWGDLYTENVSGGYWVYYFEALLPDVWTVTDGMSIGFTVDLGHGENPPYGGFAWCETVSGCGDWYWAGDNWGLPRWTAFQDYGYGAFDLAFCIGNTTTPAAETHWTQVKSLY